MAEKKFNITFDVDANITPMKNALQGLNNALKNLKVSDSLKKSIQTTVDTLEKEIANFESFSGKTFENMGDFNKANRSFEKISDLFNKLGVQIKNLKGVDPNKFLPSEVFKKVQNLQQSWTKLKQITEKGNNAVAIEATNKALKEQKEIIDSLEAKQKALKAENSSRSATIGARTKEINAANERINGDSTKGVVGLKDQLKALEDAKVSKTSVEYRSLNTELQKNLTIVRNATAEINRLRNANANNNATINGIVSTLQDTRKKITELENELNRLQTTANKSPEGIKEFIQELKSLDGVDTNEIEQAGEDLEKLQEILNNYQTNKIEELKNSLNNIDTPVEAVGKAVKDTGDKVHEYGDQCTYAKERTNELANLANQVKQFFSIGNTVQLFKRAIRSAFDTIKELDAVMTQTAVVTDFTVGDMWAQLPEYTKRANELGVSVKGAYEAATLYYQQGLSTNEVIGVSNETLKMAKIAAIDYATATDYMTSALRGFNMEVNEQSAQKVNDIYSQLAAKTAADTKEISIAMSKTAPLAHNAGMEIETTAAFLAQAIETTREAPETIGTAMKTVIARFQELKKDPALIEPVEGEIVDANKIEGALRTIGVALRDTSGQFRDLDDVFLEISQKWNSLDTNTQRYIATIAAGSRQQSRFIAMMANYDRTMELVEMANTSAGASQQQFEKTLDSMQSKLDRLKNAWNEFTMGLANNSVIKAVVDLLTDLLNTINKISSGVSGNNGILKSLVDIGVLMGGLKLGKAAFTGFFGWLQGKGKTEGQALGGSLLKGILGAFSNKPKGGILSYFNLANEVKRFKNADKLDTKTMTELFNMSGLTSKQFLKYEKLGKVLKDLSNPIDALKKGFSNLKTSAANTGKSILGIFKSIPPQALLITAGIAAITAAIVILIKHIKANSIEGKLKAAKEATKQAKEAANQAQEAYDNLLEGRSKYSELQTTLNNLTYGTTAWKEALIEANGQVLELLQTYPQLAQYITSGANGRLEISTKGWNTVVEQQENAIRRATNRVILSEITETSLENDKLYKDIGRQTGFGYKPEMLNQLIDLYKTNPVLFVPDESGNARQELIDYLNRQDNDFLNKFTADDFLDNAGAIQKYLAAVQENNTLIDSYVDNLVNTNIKLSGLTDKEVDALKTGYKEQINRAADIRIEKEKEYLENSIGNSGYLADILKEYGLSVSNNTITNFQTLYKHLANITGQEIDDGTLQSKEAMADAIAKMRYGDEIEASINKVAQRLKTDTTGGVQKILNILGSEIGEFTTEDLRFFRTTIEESDNIEEAVKSIAESFNMSTKEVEDLMVDMGYAIRDSSGNLVADFESFAQAFYDGTIELERTIYQAEDNIVARMLEADFSEKEIKNNIKSGRQLTDAEKIGLSNFMDKTSFLEAENKQKLWVQTLSNLRALEEEISKETLDLINNFNTENVVDSLLAIQDAAKNGTEETKKLAQQLLDFSSEQLNAGKALQNYMMGDEYSQIEESLQEIIKTNGKLTSSNIKKLSKESATLAKILQLDKVNASGLAKAMTAVAEGRLGINELNNALLKSLSSITTLEDVTSELQQFFSEVDEGFDETEFVGNFKKWADNLAGWVEEGKTGIDAFKKQVDLLFGEDIYEKAKARGQAGIDELASKIYQWQSYLADGGAGFFTMLATNTEQSLKSVKFSINEAGNIAFNFADDFTGSMDDVANEIAETFGVSKELAESLIEAYAALTPEFQNELEFRQARTQYASFIEELDKVDDKTVVTRNQLDLFARALGTTYEELKSELQNKYEGSIVIADWIDPETGARKKGEELWKAIMAAYGYTNQTELETGMGITTRQKTGRKKDLSGKLSPVETEEEKVWDYTVAIKYAEDNDLTKEELDEFAKDHNVTFTSKFGDGGTIEEIESKIEKANAEAAENLQTQEQDAINKLDTSSVQTKMANSVNQGMLQGGKAAIIPLANAIANTAFRGTVNLDAVVSGEYVNGTRIRTSGVDSGKSFDNTYHPTGSGGRFTREASGTDFGGLKHSEIALTGEEGYELAYDSHGAFLLGENGPEVAKLEKGTVIYPHELSKKILKGYSKSIFPSHKTGTIPNHPDGYTPGSGSGVGGMKATSYSDASSSASSLASSMSSVADSTKETVENIKDANEETEEWEKNIDWLYNKTQLINAELRTREKLERQYQRLLKTGTATGADLKAITDEEIASLKKRQEMEKEMIELRRQELKEYLAMNEAMAKYATINWELEIVQVNWGAINGITDKDEYDKFEKFKDRLEEILDEIREAEDAVEDIEDELIDIQNRGQDQYRDLEDRVLDALIKRQQDLIDEQEETNKSLTDAKNELIDSIKTNIDKMRQDRKNEETETSLAEKERRLAYLRQDTTGSNALEIKKLEKELRSERQDYTDTLIDQAIDNMKEQADEAAKQRDEQIELMKSQLEWQQKTGYWADEATRIVQEGLAAADYRSTELYSLLHEGEGVASFSNASQDYWEKELGNTIAEAKVWYENGIKQVVAAIEKLYKEDYMSEMKQQAANKDIEGLAANEEERNEKITVQGLQDQYPTTSIASNYNAGKEGYKNGNLDPKVKPSAGYMADINKAIEDGDWPKAFMYAGARDAKIESDTGVDQKYKSDSTLSMVLEKWLAITGGKKFATGGLADYTGPAWLDGSKSKPEMVLNAKDTENFIQLKNLLADSNIGNSNSGLGGDWYFNIDINVDKIDSDYDVDKVAARVKQSIYNEATYRNVNAINFLK